MFGKNEIVGQKYFKENTNAQEGKLFVTSVFYTLQGEGPFAGQPSLFVRLAKCNLNCSFCDTFFDDGEWLSVEEIFVKGATQVAKFHDIDWDPARDDPEDVQNVMLFHQICRIMKDTVLVMTGGEPLLQANISTLLGEFEPLFRDTQIESNGLISQELPTSTTLVISPKCSEKNNKYLNIHPSNELRANCLKFVISADPESPYHTIPHWALEIGRSRSIPIYVSPMNIYNTLPQKSKQLRIDTNQTTIEQRSEIDEVISFWEPGLLNMEENQKNHEYAARYAMKNNLRLNLQIHLYASLA